MSNLQHNSKIAPEPQKVFDRIDQDEKIADWFTGIMVVAIVVLFIVGSFILLR